MRESLRCRQFALVVSLVTLAACSQSDPVAYECKTTSALADMSRNGQRLEASDPRSPFITDGGDSKLTFLVHTRAQAVQMEYPNKSFPASFTSNSIVWEEDTVEISKESKFRRKLSHRFDRITSSYSAMGRTELIFTKNGDVANAALSVNGTCKLK